MSKRTNVEVGRLVAELLPTPPLTDAVLVALVIDVLGRGARDLTTVIEASESAEQAFERLVALGLGQQLDNMATAFNSVEKAKDLRRARSARAAHAVARPPEAYARVARARSRTSRSWWAPAGCAPCRSTRCTAGRSRTAPRPRRSSRRPSRRGRSGTPADRARARRDVVGGEELS